VKRALYSLYVFYTVAFRLAAGDCLSGFVFSRRHHDGASGYGTFHLGTKNSRQLRQFFLCLAVPFFILSGVIMNSGGIAIRW